MKRASDDSLSKKRSINLTIRADVIKEAKELDLNASQAAEAGIRAEIKKVREEAWRKENAAAIEAYNKRIDEEGPLLKPDWFKGEW